MIPTATLAELVEEHGGLIQTGPFGSQLHQSDYSDDGVPVVMPKDIRNGRVDESTISRIPETKAQALSRHLLRPGSIVFPRRGEIGKCAHIEPDQAGYLCGTGCIKIEPPEDVLRSKFLYYYLGLGKTVEWLERNAVGTTMLNLSTKILGGLGIPLHPLHIQDSVVSILSAYDDLIENNRRRIQLLEQSARLLYKEWFVHLRFPGHERVKIKDGVPEGWSRKPLFEIAEPTYGFAFKSSLFNTSGDGLPVTRIRDIPQGESQTYSIEEAPQGKILEDGDFIIGMDGDFHMNFWTGGAAWINQRVVRIRGLGTFGDAFLRYSLEKPIQDFNATIVGTTVAHLGAKHLKHIEVLIPTKSILNEIQGSLRSVQSQIVALSTQSRRAQNARDLLLLPLMNGKVSIG